MPTLVKRYGLGRSAYGWERHVDRFDWARSRTNPTASAGWSRSIPTSRSSVPVKRTALGRFKHEGGTYALAKDGRVVFYSGDDDRFEYIYKFVTARPWNPTDRAANKNLLDEGTLYVARFDADGKVGVAAAGARAGAATAEQRLLRPGRRGDQDAPRRRSAEGDTDGPAGGHRDQSGQRPRLCRADQQRLTQARPGRQGQSARRQRRTATSSRFAPKDGDHGFGRGAPGRSSCSPASRARMPARAIIAPPRISGWLSCPDNIAFDSRGRIWIVTDGSPAPPASPMASMPPTRWATAALSPAASTRRRPARRSAGRCLTPDDRTFFLAVQHPGEDRGSTFEKPSTRWPDFKDGMPPRPAVVAITKKGGGAIGS